MEPSAWSQNTLSGQPIMEQDEAETSPISIPRQSSMFRSYRHLPTNTSAYDSRIFLRPCLPPPASAPYRSHYLSNEVSPFWLQRSSSARNLPTANTESMISLGEASPTRNSELLDNPGPSADSYPQLDHHLYDTAHSALIERDNYLNRFSHTNPTRFSLDFGIVQRGLSDSHIPQAAPRFTNPRTNLNLNSDQPLMVNNPNSRSSLPSQSGTHNNPPAPLSASRDNNQRVLGTNRSSVRPTGMTIPTRASTSSQTRMPLNLRLRRVLAENRGYNATNNVNSIDPPGFGARPPVTLNLAPDSHRSSTTYRSAPPIHSRPLNNEATTNQASNASVNNQSGRSMDRRIRVVRQPNVVVQRVFNMPSEVQSSTSGASSVEDIQVPTVVTPDIRSILNNSESQEQQNPSESSDRSRTPEYSDSSLVEAVDVPHDGDWRTGCSGPQSLWHRLLQSERFADVWFVVGGTSDLDTNSMFPSFAPLDSGAPGGPTGMQLYARPSRGTELIPQLQHEQSSSPPERSNGMGISDPEHTVSNLICSYNSLEDGQENHEELDLNSDLDDITNEAQQSRSVTGRALIASHDQPLSTSCPENKSLRGLSETDSEFIHQVRVQSCNSVGESSNHEESALDNTTTTKSGSVESPSDRSHRVSAMQHTPCKRFAAHRLILATASPVFEAMFYGPVAEMHSRTSEQHTEYRVPDIHPKAFETMLHYVYTDEIQLNDDPDIVFYVLYAAKKYMLAPLGQRCVEHLKGLITASNVCLMLDRSLFFDEEDLTRRCWHVIDVLAPHVLSSPGLLEMDATNFISLLQRDTLNCKESEVFAAVRRWAGAECVRLGLRDVLVNRAQVAARFLPLVRFPTMTLNDFATNVAYSGFLSLEMVRDLFVHITTNDCSGPPRDGQTEASQTATDKRGDEDIDRANEECGQSMDTQLVIPCSTTQSETAHQLVSSAKNGSPLFSSEPRCGPKVWRCSRFSRTGKHAITPNANGSHQHSISFQVSAPIFLSGIGVYGSTQVGERLNVTVELKHIVPRATTNNRGCSSVGTQFHGSVDSTADTQTRRHQALPRSSSLLEVARYDWTGRPHVISRRVSSQNPEPTVLTMSGEVNRNLTRMVKRKKKTSDEDIQAVANIQIVSDGSTRVYDVTFPCPVKILAYQRYLLSVQTFQCDRPKSVSGATLATLNSSTFYIGFFGRPEVRVLCGQNDHPREKNTSTSNTKRISYRGGVTDGVTGPKRCSQRTSSHAKRPYRLKPSASANQDGDSEEFLFHFWETPDGQEHGEVDRGFLPELLFYTCS
ncbi:hypothetical protein T265_05680 [Opisthorchis viverrini]|uniref:BTB domain-containing protein n=1 Tax=Opisthorchis viverrini TaxID=6198 RepID=A0A074ZNA1_OPIVI|nr:hypothetical protein T265_05680 [Opisthorchis viverrini]KER27212.1 hypothetical protein T265_05680 [Opisthorchis viverrini]